MVGPKRDQREGDHSLIGSARARHYARTSASHEANEGCDSARRQNSMTSKALLNRLFGMAKTALSNQSQWRTNKSLGPPPLQKRKLENCELRLGDETRAFRPENGISGRQRRSRYELTRGKSGLFRKVFRRAKITGGWAERIRTGEWRKRRSFSAARQCTQPSTH